MDETGPIPRRKLYHDVVDRLLARIRSGEFAPNDQLPSERQLMQAYGVGRPAIREALLTLQRMGLIVIVHGERARVLSPTAETVIDQITTVAQHVLSTSPESLKHLKDARLFFEVGVVKIAAERASADDIERLKRALSDHRAALDDKEQFLDTDLAFHNAIADVSGNPIYSAISRAMLSWLRRFYVEIVQVPGAERVSLEEHTRIFNAVRAHNSGAAAGAMEAHLTRANELYRQLGRDLDNL